MKKKLYGIYEVRNTKDNKRYIGQGRVWRRKTFHFGALKKGEHPNIHLQRAWAKYGGENFQFKVLLYCMPDDGDYYESNLIKIYNATDDKFGYNFIMPEEDGSFTHSPKTIKKMSENKKGEKNPQWGKKGKDSPRWGKKHSPETIENLSGENNPMWGKSHSDEVRLSIAMSQGAKSFAVSKEGVKIGEWLSQRQCFRDLGISSSGINQCLNRKRQSHMGYRFEYIAD